MTRRGSLIGLAALVAALGVVSAALAARGSGVPAGGVAKPPVWTTYDQGEWTITTPAGWTRENITASADARKAVRYNGPNGEYFIVAIDPLGSDYESDATWTYAVSGKGFTVVSKQEHPGADGRYDGYLMWKTGTVPAKLAGHVWYFMFGNSKAATIDASMFQRIAESVQAK